uniref:Uncharacterized protein n=1 Tax=Sinocyclocheilus grahami TaxID=75366 RepID=A0A672K5S2_SINGR
MTVFPSATVSASRSKSMVMGEASRGSPSLQEGVLKAGWLKKQRSIMKNWQLHGCPMARLKGIAHPKMFYSPSKHPIGVHDFLLAD